MKKLLFVLLAIIVLIISKVAYAQGLNSVQVNGGIIMPMSSSKGFNVSLQYNYKYNNNISFYFYSGYSSWDKYNVSFLEDWSTVQKQTIFNSYLSDSHILIPVYVGSRLNFLTNKFFTSFAEFEFGYSYMSYNSYSIKKDINPITGEVLAYNPDQNSKKEVNENLFGLGAGVGISHPITENMNIILLFKINSQLNSNNYSFLSSKGTHTALNIGFNFNI